MGKINILNDAGTNKLTLDFNGTSDTTVDMTKAVVTDSNGYVPVAQVPYVGRRNLIINGGFDVWQRGESSTTDNAYATADRWFKYASGDTSTWGKYYDTERGNCLYIQSTATTGYGNIRQRFEGIHIPASGQEFTLSLWLKVSTGTAPYRVEVWNLTDNTNIFSNYNLGTITTEWQKFTVTFSMDSSDSNDVFHVMIGSNSCVGGAIMYFNQVQLEVGSVATPFEHRLYGEELALCQRYYYQLGGSASKTIAHVYPPSTSELAFDVRFPVTMRVVPSVSFSSTSSLAYRYAGNALQNFSRTSGSFQTPQLTPNGGSPWFTGWSHGQERPGEVRVASGTCFLEFDAEL